MGWDIHSVVQVRKDGVWVSVERGAEDGFRNYTLFGILAGARDYPNPIATSRGFPSDFKTGGSPGFVTHSFDDDEEGMWMGDRHYSHLSLAELKGRWNMAGFVSEADYLEGGYKPIAFVRSEGPVIVVKESDYEQVKADAGETPIYIQVDGEHEEVLDRLVNQLESIRERHKVANSDVRLVFGFDA